VNHTISSTAVQLLSPPPREGGETGNLALHYVGKFPAWLE